VFICTHFTHTCIYCEWWQHVPNASQYWIIWILILYTKQFINSKQNASNLFKNTIYKIYLYTHILLLMLNYLIITLTFGDAFQKQWNYLNENTLSLLRINNVNTKTQYHNIQYKRSLTPTANIVRGLKRSKFIITFCKFWFNEVKQGK
jgi:hypothetical protein